MVNQVKEKLFARVKNEDDSHLERNRTYSFKIGKEIIFLRFGIKTHPDTQVRQKRLAATNSEDNNLLSQ